MTPRSPFRRALPSPALLAVGLALLAWELWARTHEASTLLFPAPSVIGSALVRQVRSGQLAGALGATLARLGAGSLLGGLPALVLGMVMGTLPRVRHAVDPLVAGAHAIPKIAVLPILMILLGVGEAPKVVVVAAAAFFPLLVNTMTGVRQISPIHFEVARSYGASRSRLFLRVLLPGSLPHLLSGLRLALGSALLMTIALEIIAARTGLGASIWLAWQTLRVEDLYASLAAASLVGVGLNAALQALERRCAPWHVTPEI